MPLCLAIVPEADYPAFRLLCDPNYFPNSHAEYLLSIDHFAKSAAKLQMATLRVPVDPEKLRRWLNGRKANMSDLRRYALIVHNLHRASQMT